MPIMSRRIHCSGQCLQTVKSKKSLSISILSFSSRYVLSLASFLIGEENAVASLPALEVRDFIQKGAASKYRQSQNKLVDLIFLNAEM